MIMEFSVDHALPVALGVQLRGLIEYGIACGQLMPGDRLPSVREMAAQLGDRADDRQQRLCRSAEGRPDRGAAGSGTFVSRAAAGFARPQLRPCSAASTT